MASRKRNDLWLELVVVGLVAVGLGYLMGTFALHYLLGAQTSTDQAPARTEVVRRESEIFSEQVGDGTPAEEGTGVAGGGLREGKGEKNPLEEGAPGKTESVPAQARGQDVRMTSPVVTEREKGRKAVVPASEAGTLPRPAPGRLYKVVVGGGLSRRDDAQTLAEQLAAQGYNAYVPTQPPYDPQVGAFGSKENAEQLAAELRDKGFRAEVR